MFNLFGLFKRKKLCEDTSLEDLLPCRTTDDITLPVHRLVESYNVLKPTVLIIDDSVYVLDMVEDYLATIGITSENHNVLRFYGVYAPFVMRDTLALINAKHGLKIDYAIIDIVLPGKLKEHDQYSKMDGIDVAMLIDKEYSCKRMLFFSGNVLNTYVRFIEDKVRRFKEYFGKDLLDSIVFKTSTDEEVISRFIELCK